MSNLGAPGGRLRAYREEYLGFSLADMEAHYGIRGSTFNYSETQGSQVSSKILEALSRIPPPEGKQRVNIKWLVSGAAGGDMLLPPENIQIIRDMQALEGYAAGKPAAQSSEYSGPPILPGMVAMAAQMVDEALDATPPDQRPAGPQKWEAVARVARLLALDHAEGTEGTARAWLSGVRQEWAKAQTKTGA